MTDGISITWIAGHPELTISDPTALRELADLVHQANSIRVYKGNPPVLSAPGFVATARKVVALSSLVPSAQPEIAAGPSSTERWISTQEAAELLGVTDRAITKQARGSKIHARKIGRQWLIDKEGLIA